MKFEFKSLFDLQSAFPDEQSCIDHLENMIWGDVIISPFDATSKVYKCKGNKYRCKNTGKYFNVKTGTLFDNTKMDVNTIALEKYNRWIELLRISLLINSGFVDYDEAENNALKLLLSQYIAYQP